MIDVFLVALLKKQKAIKEKARCLEQYKVDFFAKSGQADQETEKLLCGEVYQTWYIQENWQANFFGEPFSQKHAVGNLVSDFLLEFLAPKYASKKEHL